MNNILSAAEIEEITGLKLPKLQLSWLHDNGFFEARLNAKNKVVMSTLYFHQQSGAKLEAVKHDANETVLNLDALNACMQEYGSNA